MNHSEETIRDNKLFTDKVCSNCGRRYPETVLNLEGAFHHNTGYICLDKKDCNRYKRKLKRRK